MDTPLSSIGNAGLRNVSEAQPLNVVHGTALDGASETVERTILNSPGERAKGCPGTGLGVGVGVGVGLAVGAVVAAVTGMLLAPVKNERTALDVAVGCGLNR